MLLLTLVMVRGTPRRPYHWGTRLSALAWIVRRYVLRSWGPLMYLRIIRTSNGQKLHWEDSRQIGLPTRPRPRLKCPSRARNPSSLNPVASPAFCHTTRLTWAVLSKATADLGLEQAGLAMEARGSVLVEDGP